MGRTLSNTMLNLSLQSAVDEALYQASLLVSPFACFSSSVRVQGRLVTRLHLTVEAFIMTVTEHIFMMHTVASDLTALSVMKNTSNTGTLPG